ncbi:MAG: hypothetical protein PHX10_12225 [Gallionellaceae bacterium]|nr:hypothetical protein [Gallionellaceae bacterium]
MPSEVLRPDYMVSRLAEYWRQQGHRVSAGAMPVLQADIGILHIDRTRVPAGLVPANPAGVPLLNGSLLDISKRHISANLLGPDSSHDGAVIIKTDANAFGKPEMRRQSRLDGQRLRRRIARKLPWRWLRELPPGTYPVLDCLAAVPDWVWRRDDLVVERFCPELEGDEFVLRLWLFFGDREYSVRLFSREPVVKVSNMTRYEYLDAVPDSLRAERARLGIDFGKLDYVMVDGEAVLLDVNKTPTVAAKHSRQSRLTWLVAGLDGYLEPAR